MVNWMVEGRKNGKTYVTTHNHTQYLISLEAIKIGRDYPELTVEECLEKAKEIFYDEN